MTHIDRSCGCEEYQSLSRRGFLGLGPTAAATAATAAVAAAVPAWLPRIALAKSHSSSRDVLLNVFLRGGADALNIVVPSGDPDYYNVRPTIGVKTVDLQPLKNTTLFGLVRGMWPLLPAYDAGHLAFVHACGTPDPTRSHFDAQKFMEYGTPNQPNANLFTGWIARHLDTSSPLGPVRAIAMANTLPRSLAGGPGALPIRNVARFDLPGRAITETQRRRAIKDMYESNVPPMSNAALDTLDTIDLLKQVDVANYRPANNAQYPTSAFGTALKNTAALIKGDIGLEVIEVDRGGWDTHATQGTIQGRLQLLLDDLAQSLAAFYADLVTTHLSKVTVTVTSEFGRRVEENGSLGTDHGHAGMMMVMGGNVNGAQVYGKWPGLSIPQRWKGLDLNHTTDYREVLSEVISKRLGNSSLSTIFPNFTPSQTLGIV